MKRLLLVGLILIAGCSKKTQLQLPSGTTQSEVISRYLDFDTTFTTPLSGHRFLSVKATMRPWNQNSLTLVDTIQQVEDGKWVVFDCDSPAETIIYASLVAEVTPACAALHARAEEFWKKNNYTPERFVDNTGTHWIKEK